MTHCAFPWARIKCFLLKYICNCVVLCWPLLYLIGQYFKFTRYSVLFQAVICVCLVFTQKFLKFWNVLNVNGNTSLDRYNNFWHCSKDAYVNSVTELLPVWAAEGRKELTDHRSVWDWIKYNIRAHAINFS